MRRDPWRDLGKCQIRRQNSTDRRFSPTTIDDTRSARQGTPVLSTLPGLPTCMTSQGQRTLKLYTGKGYPQELAAPSAVASSRGQALAAGTLLLAMDALRSGGSFAILSHNCPAINRLNVDGWESPSLSI